MGLETMGKLLLIAGAAIILLGLGFVFWGRIPFLGKLPGDIFVARGGFSVYFPIVTCLAISVVLTILVNLVIWLLRK